MALPRPLPQTLAAGAELKNTFCLTRDANAFLSQHIGDLENLETLEHYEASIEVYRKLFRLDPEVVAYDLHPEYLATKYALALPQPEKVAVQHHHAHIAARLVEHGREEAVIGVSLDGLGYGDDGRLWGGEVLVCDLLGYRRVAHLEELPLPGGAAAIAHPWRTGLGWSYALLGEEGLARATRLLGRRPDGPDEAERAAVVRQIERDVNVPLTTSSGRLFDAVAALAGVRHTISYEGQAAIELEMMASGQMLRAAGAAPYEWSLDGDPGAAALAPRAGAAEWAAARAAVARAVAGLLPRPGRRPRPRAGRGAPRAAGGRRDRRPGGGRRARRRGGAAARDPRRHGARPVPPRPRRVGALGRGALRRRVPEPAAGRPVLGQAGRRRLPGPRRRPRPGQRRRRLAGAGRGRGLYCARRAAGSSADRRARRDTARGPDQRTPPMCLALPMRITALDGARATIAAEGLEQECSVMLVPDVAVGDYVLVHAGFAISVLDEAEAQETYDLLREIAAFDEGEDGGDAADRDARD